jgi:kinesin family protein 1
MSPDRLNRSILQEQVSYLADSGLFSQGNISPGEQVLVLYIPEVEEIRISPVIARKGWLNILEQKTNGWKKRWVVSFSLKLYTIYSLLIIINNL